jgi:nicotinamidase/pyrazinamidase
LWGGSPDPRATPWSRNNRTKASVYDNFEDGPKRIPVKTVFFDVDTQIDFMLPAGALYVRGADSIIDRIAVLNRYAASQGIPVVSTADAHSEDDPEFKAWPHHCVVGTVGQQKCTATLLEKRLVIPNEACTPAIAGMQQIIVEKQTVDSLSNVNLPAILRELSADRYVVYGVVTEICVQTAVAGLLKTDARVEVVTDAIRALNDQAGAKALAEFTATGCALTTVAQVTSE